MKGLNNESGTDEKGSDGGGFDSIGPGTEFLHLWSHAVQISTSTENVLIGPRKHPYPQEAQYARRGRSSCGRWARTRARASRWLRSVKLPSVIIERPSE